MAESITLAGESHAGYSRKNNEDCFVLFNPAGSDSAIAIVADGIGGHADGEVASRMCCREMMKEALRMPPPMWDERFFKNALEKANEVIFERNFYGDGDSVMGCTVVAALFLPERVVIGNAGDSRFYLWNGQLEQISTDHKPDVETWYKITGKRVHPEELRHIVSRSVGTHHKAEMQFYTIPRRPGQRYLLCTDGLSECLNDGEISEITASAAGARDICRKLIRASILARANDNVTVIAAAERDDEQEDGRKGY